jgi:hypothetical protein
VGLTDVERREIEERSTGSRPVSGRILVRTLLFLKLSRNFRIHVVLVAFVKWLWRAMSKVLFTIALPHDSASPPSSHAPQLFNSCNNTTCLHTMSSNFKPVRFE